MKDKIKIPQLIRYFSRYCGEEEDRLILLEMDKDPRFNRLVTILQKTWRTNRKFVSTTDIDVAWHKFKARIESSTSVVKEKSAGYPYPDGVQYRHGLDDGRRRFRSRSHSQFTGG